MMPASLFLYSGGKSCYIDTMDPDALRSAAAAIKKDYSDAQVILFGSAAADKDTEESDIDLCIVLENPKGRLRTIGRNIRKSLYPILRRPIDLLVYDKETFRERSALSLTLEAEISEKGQRL